MNLNSNILWSLISIIVSIICSIGFGYLFYKLALKKKSITYDIITKCLISKEIAGIKGLNVNYNSSILESLNSSTIKIKNSGNTIIDKNDIAQKTPISLSTKGKFLFDKQVVQLSNDDDNIQLKFETNESGTCSIAIIDFDFISKKQIIEFSVLHTKNIKFNGRIKDGDIVETQEYNYNFKKNKLFQNAVFVCIIISAILFEFVSYKKRTEEVINLNYS